MNEVVIEKVADAIAHAEGYYVAGSRPQRNNNPGDLEVDVTGEGIGRDGPYIVYATPQDGLDALKYLVRLMFKGSRIYKPDMTITEVAIHYTATSPMDWARAVAQRLGVGVYTRLQEIR